MVAPGVIGLVYSNSRIAYLKTNGIDKFDVELELTKWN